MNYHYPLALWWCDKKGAMLRRLSDVTIGSIEKFLKIGGKESGEKKRKFIASEFEEESEIEREEENVVDKEVKDEEAWNLDL